MGQGIVCMMHKKVNFFQQRQRNPCCINSGDFYLYPYGANVDASPSKGEYSAGSRPAKGTHGGLAQW